jgi:hypothetical protein
MVSAEGLLERFLGLVDIAEQTDEGRQDPPRLGRVCLGDALRD